MRIHRIERDKYLGQIMSGLGAARSERNRWNGLNTPMIYAAQSRALALLDLLVHTDFRKGAPKDRYYVEIDIPDDLTIAQVDVKELPPHWASSPPGFETQQLGDLFVAQQQAAVLRVPSSTVPNEYNYLINPLHQSMAKIKVISIEALNVDSRLFDTFRT